MASTKSLKKGDKVEWSTSQGATVGEVVGKVAQRTRIKSYTANASKEDPQFKVKSAKSGKPAIHKASALTKKPSR